MDVAFNHELEELRSTVAALKFGLALLRFTHLLRKTIPISRACHWAIPMAGSG